MQTPLQGAFRCVWMQNRVFLLMFLLPLLTTTHRSEENDKEEAASGFCDLRKENYIGIWLVRQLAGLGMLYELNFLFCAVCRIGFSDIP